MQSVSRFLLFSLLFGVEQLAAEPVHALREAGRGVVFDCGGVPAEVAPAIDRLRFEGLRDGTAGVALAELEYQVSPEPRK